MLKETYLIEIMHFDSAKVSNFTVQSKSIISAYKEGVRKLKELYLFTSWQIIGVGLWSLRHPVKKPRKQNEKPKIS